MTFSYTSAFWDWEDWELELDWLALRGVNLPLAWVGYEKVLSDVFRETGFTEEEINGFLSGPAYQAWNRFGNIQGSWGGDLPTEWIEGQFELQKKIVRRMVELGMTPVLPSFAGFVPHAITRVLPDATVVNSSQWAGMPLKYTQDTFLEPTDPNYARLQKSFLTKQIEAYGNVTHFYTLDQYNEMTPYSGDTDILRNVSKQTLNSLKAVDPDATWLMQGWLFYNAADFWSNERIEAYLSGAKDFHDMLILDLNADSYPVWSRTESFFGKAWIWCQLHDFGGNMDTYGQIQNITKNPVEALNNSPNLVGMGNAPESQEGNEIVYDLMLDQAWSTSVVDTKKYFHNWVTSRYSDGRAQRGSVPKKLYEAWEILRTTAYDNTNLTAWALVPKSIIGQSPSIDAKQQLLYDPADMVKVWKLMMESALFADPVFRYDIVDITRQVLANAFVTTLPDLESKYKSGASASEFMPIGNKLLHILQAMDAVLMTNKNFRLSTWTSSARAWSKNGKNADYYEYNARDQVTLWSPGADASLNDYAQKMWGGLVSGYYYPRWRTFMEYLKDTPADKYDKDELRKKLFPEEQKWAKETSGRWAAANEDLQAVLRNVQNQLGDVFK